MAPDAELVERLRQTIPELPWLQRKRIQEEWGISDEVMRDLVNAGAVELVAATVEQGASSEHARAWWGNFLVQKANEAGVELDALPITPAQVAAVVKLVDDGKLSNKLARQVVEGVLAGEGEPEQVMKDRGLAVVRDDSADPGRGRRGAGRQPRCRREDPRRQGAGGRRDRRCGDEGDQGPGRRRPGTGTRAGRVQLARIKPVGRAVFARRRRLRERHRRSS